MQELKYGGILTSTFVPCLLQGGTKRRQKKWLIKENYGAIVLTYTEGYGTTYVAYGYRSMKKKYSGRLQGYRSIL